MLVIGQLAFAEVANGLLGNLRTVHHDDQLDGLAGFFVWHADHSAFQHTGHLRNHLFHLVGIDVKAADQHHVLFAVNDGEVTALVHDANVASAEIAIRGHDAGGFIGALPVTGHHLRAFDGNFARLAVDGKAIVIHQNHIRAGHRQANGAGKRFARHRVARDDGAGL